MRLTIARQKQFSIRIPKAKARSVHGAALLEPFIGDNEALCNAESV